MWNSPRLTIRFSENVLDSTNEFELVIADESKLAGLPESAVAMARDRRPIPKASEAPSWRFTLQAPSYVALMTYLDDGKIRRHVYEAYVNRALEGERDKPARDRSASSNCATKRPISWAIAISRDLVLEDRMAHTGERAQEFLADLKNQNGRALREGER